MEEEWEEEGEEEEEGWEEEEEEWQSNLNDHPPRYFLCSYVNY